MRILHASSEVHPYSKTGGLADMVGALAKTLARTGHEVAVVTPLYRGIQEKFPALKKFDWWIDLPLGSRRVPAEVWILKPSERLTIYFIHAPEFFDRAGLYSENGSDYWDNGERFVFFSKCVVQLACYLPLQPQVVHIHDWQAGLVPALIKHQKESEEWGSAPRTCLTIHNLAYQGVFPASAFALTNLPENYFSSAGVEYFGTLNCLKAGIQLADAITTVSPRYAREITTEEFGYGLDGLLRKRKNSVFGILNGVDYEEWNTTHNPSLKHPYSSRSLHGKTLNKLDLQREVGLPVDADIPLFGSITRLVEQKGVDIQLGALEEMLQSEMQFVLLGSGSPQFEKAYQTLAKRFPTKAAVRIGFDQAFSHHIEAGCDFFLMPSRFEPCGLNQMYSQIYGTIPIVRRTGGLDDTVVDISENKRKATGIKFGEYSSRAVAKAIRKALTLYRNPNLLTQYRRHTMKQNFSWGQTCEQFVNLYG